MKPALFAVVMTAVVATAALAQAPAPIASAVADPGRPAEDRAKDAARKPAETLGFAGIAPGQSVVELFPGKGYFTRILSKTVGPQGRIYTIPWEEPDTGLSRRLAHDPAYGNITLFEENLLAFRPAAPVDVVFTVQNYHDIASPQRPQVNQVLFKALKPGGVYFIVDHAARNGSGYTDLPLHRIDEAMVKAEVARAGCVFVGESEILRAPADDRTLNVFDPRIRGKTDQFLLKFMKPAGKPEA